MRALPLNAARELLITGAVLDADRGHQLGFVNRVTESGGALAAARELARTSAPRPPSRLPPAWRRSPRSTTRPDATGWDLTAAAVERVKASDDIGEGVTAFFEKRQPRWTGH